MLYAHFEPLSLVYVAIPLVPLTVVTVADWIWSPRNGSPGSAVHLLIDVPPSFPRSGTPFPVCIREGRSGRIYNCNVQNSTGEKGPRHAEEAADLRHASAVRLFRGSISSFDNPVRKAHRAPGCTCPVDVFSEMFLRAHAQH